MPLRHLVSHRAGQNPAPGQSSLLQDQSTAQVNRCYRAVGIVRDLVTNQYAGSRIAGTCVRDRSRTIRGNDVHVKINQTVTADGWARSSHAVGGVAGGTTEAVIPGVVGVPTPTGIVAGLVQNYAQIMALGTQGVGASYGQIGSREEIGN